MANYYCIMAGLPDLKLSDTKPGYSISELREQLRPEMGSKDKSLLHFLFLQHDCRNLVKLLRYPDTTEKMEDNGNYDHEQLKELLAEANEIDLGTSRYPQFMVQFAREYGENKDKAGYYAEDEILLLYYRHCTENCPNALMREWYQLNFDVTNIMTAMIARRQGWRVTDYVKGEGEVQEMIRTNDTHDFNLGQVYGYIAEIMKMVDEEDPVRKERMLDAFKWAWLDERTFQNPFSVEAVFAYLCKLEIQERWARLDVEQGKETFQKIINDLRGEAQVPEEFIRK